MPSDPAVSISPFQVDIPESDLLDLRDRLARTRWPTELPGAGWDRGVPVDCEFNRGGHFAAMEVPDLLINDIRTFFRTLR